MESSPREQTRFIEDLRDEHLGEEMWIIGCGPSLDDFPDDFFDQKLTIALNWAIIAFPQCTYWHGHHECFREYLRDEKPEFLRKSIICFPFPGPYKHGRIRQPTEFFGDLTSQPIWLHFGDCRPIPKKRFEVMIDCIMARQPKCVYRASMTVAHTAVAAAAAMGAKRIIMVGCEHSVHGHAQSRGMGDCYGRKRGNPYQVQHKNGTRWLAELLGNHGIEVARYNHGSSERFEYEKGYQPIDIKEAGNNGNKKV